MKKHNQQYYLKMCRNALLEIQNLGPDQGVAFLRLKKKAKKYLEKARSMEKQ